MGQFRLKGNKKVQAREKREKKLEKMCRSPFSLSLVFRVQDHMSLYNWRKIFLIHFRINWTEIYRHKRQQFLKISKYKRLSHSPFSLYLIFRVEHHILLQNSRKKRKKDFWYVYTTEPNKQKYIDTILPKKKCKRLRSPLRLFLVFSIEDYIS